MRDQQLWISIPPNQFADGTGGKQTFVFRFETVQCIDTDIPYLVCSVRCGSGRGRERGGQNPSDSDIER